MPFRADVVRAGNRVLDVGAGAGTDTLIAARLIGCRGKAFALDMTPAMLANRRRNITLADADNVEVVEGNAEAIPLPDASIDVITSNGVLNLVPDKERAFAELFRVLRPGVRVQIADIVVGRPVSDSARANPKLWAECVVGASPEQDYLGLFASAGFTDVRVLRSFDYFSGSTSPDTRRVAAVLGAKSIEIVMTKAVTR
jgi:SAM-dependent methyltransferase